MAAQPYAISPSDILYEDNHLLVIDKPAGVATMGAPQDQATMARLAAAYIKDKYQKPGNVYIGVVSRLDRRVSGVLVLARTSKAASRVSEQIRRHQVAKRYLAWVEGAIEGYDESALVQDWLRKNEKQHRMELCSPPPAKSNPSSNAQTRSLLAELNLRCLARNQKSSLVEIELITGRKHQIRVQLAGLGHPVIGDTKYGAVAPQKAWERAIALHCCSTRLKHPTRDELLTFESSPVQHWRGFPRQWASLAK